MEAIHTWLLNILKAWLLGASLTSLATQMRAATSINLEARTALDKVVRARKLRSLTPHGQAAQVGMEKNKLCQGWRG